MPRSKASSDAPLRPDDVFLLFHRNPNQISAQQVGQIQIRGDIPQGIGTLVVVDWNWEIARDHGYSEIELTGFLADSGDFLEWCLCPCL